MGFFFSKHTWTTLSWQDQINTSIILMCVHIGRFGIMEGFSSQILCPLFSFIGPNLIIIFIRMKTWF